MSTKTKPLTRAKAEAALASVKAQWKSWLEPQTIDGETYEPLDPKGPTLAEDYTDSGHWAIVWEEGPDDWAMRVTDGGPAESDFVLMHDAAVEFGVAYDASQVKGPGPAPSWPTGVYGEPIMSFVLGLYPE